MIIFNDIDAFGAKVPWHSGAALEVLRAHFKRASRHCCVRTTTLLQPSDQQESRGAVILVEALAFPQSGGFDEQLMRQRRDKGCLRQGGNFERCKLPAVAACGSHGLYGANTLQSV